VPIQSGVSSLIKSQTRNIKALPQTDARKTSRQQGEEEVGRGDMSYRSEARKGHLTSEGYFEYLDQRLGFSRGTIYDLCLAAIKSKIKAKSGVKVTYRGETERQIRMTPRHSVQVRKAIFLIEFKMTKAGKQIDRVVQVHLEI
jgi:hypothetical protein